MSALVRELLDQKGRAVTGVPRDATAFEAVEIMVENNIGCVLVLTRAGAVSGICSERDIFRKVILEKQKPAAVPVADIMTPKRRLVTVDADTTLTECMDLMTRNRVRHLPVMGADGALEGIISIGDVVKTLSSERELMIRQLEHYIGSSL